MSGRFRNKADATQLAIVQRLRDAGASVENIREPIDLAIGWQGRTILAEVKTPKGKAGTFYFKQSQVTFFRSWRGGLAIVLTSIDDVPIALSDAAHTLRPTEAQLARIRD